MRHAVQDGVDARSRALARPGSQWHPILAAVEVDPGMWIMIAPDGTRYGVLRLLEIGGEHGYRAITWARRSEDRQLIGYYRSLRGAAMAAHRHWLAQHAQPGGINGT